jgi:hypothetical protein
MSKRCVMLIGVLFLATAGTSEATPLDSPDIVYIDGLPCNRLCRAYLAWSHQLSSPPATAQLAPKVAAPLAGLRAEKSKPETHAGAGKSVDLHANPMPQAKTAVLRPASHATADSNTTPAAIVDSHPKADAAGPDTKAIQRQVMAAAAVAEQVTTAAVPAPEQKQETDGSDHPETTATVDVGMAAPASPINTDFLVAVLMARPEIKSVSGLASKSIAIDDRHPAFDGNVRTAIAAAGAAEVQLSGGPTGAIDRLIGGEVPAAVVALVSPEAAQGFPEITGFTIFRILFSPRSLNAQPDTP